MSDSVRPHRRQPTRLRHPWDSPGKNTGVGCPFLLQCTKVKSESEVAQSCPVFHDPRDCSLPGSSVHGAFQARVLEWVAIAFSIGLYGANFETRSLDSEYLIQGPGRVIKWLRAQVRGHMTGVQSELYPYQLCHLRPVMSPASHSPKYSREVDGSCFLRG